ncbi:YkvA family protein [Amedibacillus sp. YH-ame6]
MNIKERAKQLKVDIPALFLCLKSNKTPRIAKIFAAVTVAYALSPIDIIPDFIPFLGYFDDIIILPALILWTLKWIPKELFEEFREEAKGMWKNGKPKKWYFAIPILAIWFSIIYLIVC